MPDRVRGKVGNDVFALALTIHGQAEKTAQSRIALNTVYLASVIVFKHCGADRGSVLRVDWRNAGLAVWKV